MPTCQCCGQKIPVGQARLTSHEISRLPMGNQYDDNLTLIEWQVVKGAAVFHEVEDWTSKIDTSLTYEENVSLMEKYGHAESGSSGPTMRDLAAKEQARMRQR